MKNWPRVSMLFILPTTAALVGVLVSIAYHSMFLAFQTYDDEGCMLIQFKQIHAGRAIYDDVFTIYGPFYYLFKSFAYSALKLSVTHDVGRMFTIVLWLTSVTLSGVIVWRISRSAIAAWLACFGVFRILHAMTNEPGHPQELCGLLLVLAVLLATFAGTPLRNKIVAIGLGVIGGTLIMTKINVGIFLLMASGAAMLIAGPRGRWATALIVAYSACLLAAPLLLMRAHLDQFWFRDHGLNVSFSLASLLVIGFSAKRISLFTFPSLALIASAVLGAVAAIVVATRLQGSSWSGILEGCFLNGPKLGTTFAIPVHKMDGTWPIPATAFAVSVLIVLIHRTSWARTFPVVGLLLAMRIGLGIALLSPAFIFTTMLAHPLLIYGPPFTALVLLPLLEEERSPGESFGRLFLAALATTESLWAYPVAGSQLAFGTFLCVVAAAVFINDGLNGIMRIDQAAPFTHAKKASTATPRGIQIMLKALLIVLVVNRLYIEDSAAQQEYAKRTSLALPGSRRIRLPAAQVNNLQQIVRTVRRNADTLVSIPGINSFYLWCEIEPPTGLNLTNWMTLFNAGQQERIIRAIEGHPRACAITSQKDLLFWSPEGVSDALLQKAPLVRYVAENFQSVLNYGPYRFFVRRDRTTYVSAEGQVLPLPAR